MLMYQFTRVNMKKNTYKSIINMKEIARQAGVTRTTVSYVLNERYKKDLKITDQVVQKVFAISKKLGYRRNALACLIKKGNSNIIGFLGDIGEQGNAYMTGMLKGMTETLQDNNYLLKLFSLTDQNFKELCRQCVEQRLGGVICRLSDELKLEYLRREFAHYKIPVVLLGNSIQHDWCSRVITDDISGITLALEHLVSLGHRKIGHLTIDVEMGLVIARREGFIKGLKIAGIPFKKKSIFSIPPGFAMHKDYYALFDNFFKSFKPTAVICASDALAMKLEIWAYARGVRIPEALSITGFGNQDFSLLACPPLTTIAQPMALMGKRAAEIILEIAEKKEISYSDELLPVKLVIRESTGLACDVSEQIIERAIKKNH